MSDRLSSGSDKLDSVLDGGLPLNGITMLSGRPGTGKTILAEQYLFHNATVEQPAIYLSTVSEPLEKLLRYGQSLEYFDNSALGSKVMFEDLGHILNNDGLGGVMARITELVQTKRPGLMVIDSFKALRAYEQEEGAFRRFLHHLAGMLSAFPVTSFWVGEYDGADATEAPEFAVADAIIALGTDRTAERETRVLQVLKLRGSGYLAGKHSYRLSQRGLELFPRLADRLNIKDYGGAPERMSSGVPALDGMLLDGYWRGSATVIAGPSGIGKTLLALHFVFAGAQQGERGLIATFQENPVQLERILNGFGWSQHDPDIALMYRTPVDLYLDEWVHDFFETVERTGARRVAIDSLGDLRAACGDELRFREYIYSLLQRCARANVSVMMTQEVPELFGITRLSEYGISHLSDNVVLLQFLRGDSELKRAITVLKTRGSAHIQQLRQFDITPEGLVLGEHFDARPEPALSGTRRPGTVPRTGGPAAAQRCGRVGTVSGRLPPSRWIDRHRRRHRGGDPGRVGVVGGEGRRRRIRQHGRFVIGQRGTVPAAGRPPVVQAGDLHGEFVQHDQRRSKCSHRDRVVAGYHQTREDHHRENRIAAHRAEFRAGDDADEIQHDQQQRQFEGDPENDQHGDQEREVAVR